MSEERKKLIWPSIAAMLVVLPVLYVVSFGPVCWLVSRTGNKVNSAYLPIAWTLTHGPRALSNAIESYARIGMKFDSAILIENVAGSTVYVIDYPAVPDLPRRDP